MMSHGQREALLVWWAQVLRQDLLEVAHHRMGVMNWQDMNASGEAFFISEVLAPFFVRRGTAPPVIFDVGANTGTYSEVLLSKIGACQL